MPQKFVEMGGVTGAIVSCYFYLSKVMGLVGIFWQRECSRIPTFIGLSLRISVNV